MAWISVPSSLSGRHGHAPDGAIDIEFLRRVPPNVIFEIDDLTQEWTYPNNFFDFIHVRTLGGAIKDWVAFLKEALE